MGREVGPSPRGEGPRRSSGEEVAPTVITSRKNPLIQDLRALARRVRLRHEPSYEQGYPDRRPAEVSIRLTDGRTVRREVELARGEPEAPVTQADLDEKFFSNARLSLDEASSRVLRDAIMDLDNRTPSEVASVLARARA